MSLNFTSYLAELNRLIDNLKQGDLEQVIDCLEQAWKDQKRIFVAGNGGSAATASHMVCDLTKGSQVQGVRPLAVIGLTDNVAHLSALSNDVSYDESLRGQLMPLAQKNDVLIGISASGNSTNLVKAFEFAKDSGMKTVGLLGFDGGKLKELSDCLVLAESSHYGPVEDIHLIINHLVVEGLRDYFQTKI